MIRSPLADLSRGLLLLGLVGVVPGSASAHDAQLPISGDGVVVRGEPAVSSGSEEFSFSSTDPNLLVSHDPAQAGTWVLVRGEGANAGRTPLIALDPTMWGAGVSGFVYDDATGGADGITSVVLDDGALSIAGSGSGWPWSPADEQDAVWVHFRIANEWFCAEFPGVGASVNAAGDFQSGATLAPVECPEVVCGNGVVEGLEACDDGNLVEDDGCTSVCEVGECTAQEFATTFEAIQTVVFDNPTYGCATLGCHVTSTAFQAGNLDLTAGVSYEALLGPDGLGAASDVSEMLRVEPLDPQLSFLFRKLASKLDPDLPEVPLPTNPATEGEAMPRSPFFTLSADHLEAIRLWIRNAAPEDKVVEGTQALLGACLAEPDPQKTPVPLPPPGDTGIQLQQPPYPLLGRTPETQGEDEICMATYYDVSGLVPESSKVPCTSPFGPAKRCSHDNTRCDVQADCGGGNTCDEVGCFAWHRQVLRQDPQSHHSIITIYTGTEGTEHESWGAWSRKSDEPADACYPLSWPDRNSPPAQCLCEPVADLDGNLGYAPECSGEIVTDIACIGFGPGDDSGLNLAGGGSNQLVLVQEPFYDQTLAAGVYSVLPVRGIVQWNSHSFNLSSQDTTMAQYLNLHFAGPEDQQARSQPIFDARYIFAQFTPAFETNDVCSSYTIPQGARLFQLSSHTHQRGVNWRTWLPPNQQCRPECQGHPATTTFFGCDEAKVCVGGEYWGEDCTYWGACADNETGALTGGACRGDDDCGGGMYCESIPGIADELCGGPGLCQQLPLCEGPRQDSPVYRNLEYSDPLNLEFDPPLVFDNPDPEDRTFLYCSEYDNGGTSRATVKLQSTAPSPPDLDFFGLMLPASVLQPLLGGPCRDSVSEGRFAVVCLDGPHKGELCDGDHSFCGDPALELCDACPSHGGITTEDEMFILLGDFFIPAPEPSQILLALVALGGVGLLARRRRD